MSGEHWRGWIAQIGMRRPGTLAWVQARAIVDEGVTAGSATCRKCTGWGYLEVPMEDEYDRSHLVNCDECRGSGRPEGWLRDQVRRSAATLDGLPPEMREQMAHRTLLRKPTPTEDAQ